MDVDTHPLIIHAHTDTHTYALIIHVPHQRTYPESDRGRGVDSTLGAPAVPHIRNRGDVSRSVLGNHGYLSDHTGPRVAERKSP